ncbi:MAG TPA: lysine--tRNA ligase [Candidatus Pacearchaeota archaeon]|nr:lysine--tRNA ligase [Candidatus Pacearchaeota archaeon]HOK94305.1 lysine--tRNA ligase [Candidatus Pacearchaeota archaeon]HPO75339.1 lysine--tRNA ligase [Candidatus Pacearchaeota archaeon]
MAKSTLEEIRKQREEKLKNLRKAGINPYPQKAISRLPINEVLLNFEKLKGKELTLVGRIKSIREHGGSTFLHFEDGSGKIQAFLRRDKLGKEQYQFFLDNFDIGDFVLIKGELFETKRGEKTIEAKEYQMLSKSLLPLPEKWHGLQDVEERFRKRYLDLLMNPEVREKFVLRSKIISEIRKYLEKEGFIEVETPILQSIPGGAAAEPFKTHLNALDIDLYLRIAPELYLKRLLVGGFEKVFEIGRVFRNEGMDKSHNPDFTTLEFYWAYVDYEVLMEFSEKMLENIVTNIFGSPKITYQGKEIDFTTPFERVDFFALLTEKIGAEPQKLKDEELQKIAEKLKIPTEKKSRAKLLDDIFKKECREEILSPTFVLHQPIELTPLAKRDEKDPSKAARFQLVVAGWELINAFSELNDPIEEKKRFEEEAKAREKGEKETHPFDEDYIEALEYGMPPAGGLGMGIDRLCALLTDSKTLREIILFPLMKPQK